MPTRIPRLPSDRPPQRNRYDLYVASGRRRLRRRRRRGISLVEAAISSLLVGLVLVGGMKCLGSVVRGRMRVGQDGQGQQLAQQLMTEVLNKAYEDPDGPPIFGPEEAALDRSAFDDVDDFHNWSSEPPQDRAGVDVFNADGYRREVTVEFVDPTDPSTVSASDQGVKRITVRVFQGTETVAQLVALRGNPSEL